LSAQLPAALVASLGLDVVPMSIAVDDLVFDEPDLDVDRFYASIDAGRRAATSQPSPGRFADAYAAAHARGNREVLSIHVGSQISGTVGSAEVAAREAPLPVTVVDTGTASFGVGICVLAAAEAIAAGASAAEVANVIEQLVPSIGNVFVAPTAPGGRIPATAGIPVLSFVAGRAETLATARSLERSAEIMAAHVGSQSGSLRAAVGHASVATMAAADALATALGRSNAIAEVLRYRVGPSVGAHTGSLSFGAFLWPASS
jgi:DegV family protein with EDD domain